MKFKRTCFDLEPNRSRDALSFQKLSKNIMAQKLQIKRMREKEKVQLTFT